MKSIFSNLPNDLIMKIIKINYDEAYLEAMVLEKKKQDYYWRWRFAYCMYELKYEWNCLETEYFNED